MNDGDSGYENILSFSTPNNGGILSTSCGISREDMGGGGVCELKFFLNVMDWWIHEWCSGLPELFNESRNLVG